MNPLNDHQLAFLNILYAQPESVWIEGRRITFDARAAGWSGWRWPIIRTYMVGNELVELGLVERDGHLEEMDGEEFRVTSFRLTDHGRAECADGLQYHLTLKQIGLFNSIKNLTYAGIPLIDQRTIVEYYRKWIWPRCWFAGKSLRRLRRILLVQLDGSNYQLTPSGRQNGSWPG